MLKLQDLNKPVYKKQIYISVNLYLPLDSLYIIILSVLPGENSIIILSVLPGERKRRRPLVHYC